MVNTRGRVPNYERDERSKLLAEWGVDTQTMVKAICSGLRLSHIEIGEMLGVDQSAISGYRLGKLPRLNTLVSIKGLYDRIAKKSTPLNLRDFIESVGAMKDGALVAWGASSVVWRVRLGESQYIVNEETGDTIDLGTCSSLPAEGWRTVGL